MPYTSPRFLKFELLPEHDEDLSYPPYTLSIKNRKRQRQRDDEGGSQFVDPIAGAAAIGSSTTMRMHVDFDFNCDFVPQKRQRLDVDSYASRYYDDGDNQAQAWPLAAYLGQTHLQSNLL